MRQWLGSLDCSEDAIECLRAALADHAIEATITESDHDEGVYAECAEEDWSNVLCVFYGVQFALLDWPDRKRHDVLN